MRILTKRGWFIIDDISLPGDSLAERRAELIAQGKKKQLYTLTEQINYMRQLFKYKAKTSFIDSKGYMFTYHKTSKLNTVVSRKIFLFCEVDDYSVFIVEGIYQPFIVDYLIKDRGIKFASIMETKDGHFLYDLTKEYHEPYKRKI